MKKHFCLTAMALMMSAPAYAATTGFALNSNGSEIVVFDDLGNSGPSRTLSLSGGMLDAITYRPFTQQLYGYQVGMSGGPDTIFTVDLDTGALTDTMAVFNTDLGVAAGAKIDLDFNTTLDATRIVSTAEDNLVYFPSNTGVPSGNAGRVIRATDLFYGDSSQEPEIFANAYTNAVQGEIAKVTQQYALDADSNSLVTLANNAGTLATVGQITLGGMTLDFDNVGALEIVSARQGKNTALALLNIFGGPASGTSGIYEIDLETGAASFFADLDGDTVYSGFAATTDVSPVPLPAAGWMLFAGVGGLMLARKRRKA